MHHDWSGTASSLGGAPAGFEAMARLSQAFLRPRG